VLDAWSRRVVGWAMRSTLETEIVTAALDCGRTLPVTPERGSMPRRARDQASSSAGAGRPIE
jgi:hypothetical protein